MDNYQHTKQRLIQAGENPLPVDELARKIAKAESIAQAQDYVCALEKAAHQLPWPQDHDFGALALEKYALECQGELANAIRTLMLEKAINLATWCAKCSTSGGEALARSEHIQALKTQLEEQC